jgi:hypothetical protein
MLVTAIGTFLGAMLSILGSIYIEYQRKPKLSFKIEEPPADKTFPSGPGKEARFLRVQLCNNAMPRFLKWLGRDAALQCYGHIQFHHILDGAPILSSPMPIRWAASEEPFTYEPTQNGGRELAFDITKYHAAFFRNCFPGTKEIIDVVARFDNEDDCYGWSNESYLRDWRNPDWKLPSGRYFVNVTVTSAGESVAAVFKLENSVVRKHFRLMEVSQGEAKKLK